MQEQMNMVQTQRKLLRKVKFTWMMKNAHYELLNKGNKMKQFLCFFIFIFFCLNVSQYNGNATENNFNYFKDTCSYIDYGTKSINIWTSMADIFSKYGKIEPNCEYGHGRGYAYYDTHKKVYLIFGYMDGGAEQIVIAKRNEVNITNRSICELSVNDITTKKGIKLGMNKSKVRSILGEPSVKTANTLEYYATNINCSIDGKIEYILLYEGIYTFKKGKLVMIDLANTD